MFIDSIILNNFRAYKGVNQISFQKNGKARGSFGII